MTTPIFARVIAFAASAAVTLSIVAMLADYGLPQESGAQLFAAAGVAPAK